MSVEVSHDFAGDRSGTKQVDFPTGEIYPNRSLDTVEGLLPERAFC